MSATNFHYYVNDKVEGPVNEVILNTSSISRFDDVESSDSKLYQDQAAMQFQTENYEDEESPQNMEEKFGMKQEEIDELFRFLDESIPPSSMTTERVEQKEQTQVSCHLPEHNQEPSRTSQDSQADPEWIRPPPFPPPGYFVDFNGEPQTEGSLGKVSKTTQPDKSMNSTLAPGEQGLGKMQLTSTPTTTKSSKNHHSVSTKGLGKKSKQKPKVQKPTPRKEPEDNDDDLEYTWKSYRVAHEQEKAKSLKQKALNENPVYNSSPDVPSQLQQASKQSISSHKPILPPQNNFQGQFNQANQLRPSSPKRGSSQQKQQVTNQPQQVAFVREYREQMSANDEENREQELKKQKQIRRQQQQQKRRQKEEEQRKLQEAQALKIEEQEAKLAEQKIQLDYYRGQCQQHIMQQLLSQPPPAQYQLLQQSSQDLPSSQSRLPQQSFQQLQRRAQSPVQSPVQPNSQGSQFGKSKSSQPQFEFPQSSYQAPHIQSQDGYHEPQTFTEQGMAANSQQNSQTQNCWTPKQRSQSPSKRQAQSAPNHRTPEQQSRVPQQQVPQFPSQSAQQAPQSSLRGRSTTPKTSSLLPKKAVEAPKQSRKRPNSEDLFHFDLVPQKPLVAEDDYQDLTTAHDGNKNHGTGESMFDMNTFFIDPSENLDLSPQPKRVKLN
ncbi:hypothetical protein CJJ07_002736 [Candidozyma auris]|nr:hypothetical protein CJJ07_002736 [[Candida] auris]QEL62611.1 hypothetical protein CJJ09_004790 [[Candida] auris]